MNPKALIKAAEQIIRSNSPAILGGLGVSGVVGTAYLAARAGFKHGFDKRSGNFPESKTNKQKAINYAKYYGAPVTVGVVTIGCIIGAVKIGNRRTAAITAAYSISEKAFAEYKEKVAEKVGERKAQQVRDEVAQEKVTATAPGREIVLMGSGPVPCCELHSNRYFYAEMETLNRARNEINDRILREEYATLAEFHTLVGIPTNRDAGVFGWTKEGGLLSLEITTALMDETRPCIAFNYNYLRAL